MSNTLLIFALIAAAVLIRLGIGRLNHARIRRYIADQGGEVLEITWMPFGAGWFGEKDSVIYEVRYRDRDDNVHEATCKTSMWSGVYFTNDNVSFRPRPSVPAAPPSRFRVATPTPTPAPSLERLPATAEDEMTNDALIHECRRLRDENRQLRAEIERLRKEIWK